MESASDMRTKVLGRAGRDAEFRARLLADPKGAIGEELGVTMPASPTIEVHEEGAMTGHLDLLPASRLSEADLRAVHGGIKDFSYKPDGPRSNSGSDNWNPLNW